MSGIVTCEPSSVDYFATLKRPQSTRTSFSWDSNPYNDPALTSDSCDSTLPSPTSPEPLSFPPTAYTLPKTDSNPEIKSEQAFNFGTFEDWMRWDDPSDAALSPTSEFFPDFKAEPASPTMSGLELQGSGYGARHSMTEESAVFGDDPMSEEPLFQTPTALISPPITDMSQREGLYSTPLSWSRPAAGTRQSQQYNNNNSKLTPQEESKLRSIAMPSQSQYPASPTSTPSSPEPISNRKRKSSVEDEEDDESPEPATGRHPPIKKTAHNMIEKRYRTNLNDKIAALRDSVPSLRVMSKKNSRSEVQEDLQGLTPAHKLNKATVLSKATEYIAHLEKRNKYLAKENANLKSRVDAFEILVMSRQQPQQTSMLNSQHAQQRASMAARQQQQQQQQQQSNRQYIMDGFGPI